MSLLTRTGSTVLTIDTQRPLPGWFLQRAGSVWRRRFHNRRHGFHCRIRLQLDLKPGLPEEGAGFMLQARTRPVPQGRPKIAHRFNGGQPIPNAPKPRRGERNRVARWVCSSVPVGTRFPSTRKPSDESLGYSLSPYRAEAHAPVPGTKPASPAVPQGRPKIAQRFIAGLPVN